MKILVVSDSHNYLNNLINVINIEKPNHIIHLGDNTVDAFDISSIFPNIPITSVCGNNDYGYDYEKIEIIDGFKFFVCHGHTYNVRRNLSSLEHHARSNGCHIALFGHTHSSLYKEVGDLIILNPGSISYSYDGKPASYSTIETNAIENKLTVNIKYKMKEDLYV